MDWNCGATPLDAWLNQSAVPSIVPLPQTHRHQSHSSSEDLAIKEREDLKVFRTIHIEGIEGSKSTGTPRNSAIDPSVLEPRTQIYLRNILDRYHLLPSYLALRLSKANCARASRLESKRHDRGHQLTSKPVPVSGYDRPPTTKRQSSIDDVAQSPRLSCRDQDGTNHDVMPLKVDKPRSYTCATCNRCFASWKHLKRHERSHQSGFVCELCSKCFNERHKLLTHYRKIHMTDSLLSSELRFHVALEAPTAMIRQADEIPVTYLNKGQAYTVTIHDNTNWLQSPVSFRCRTIFRISFDDELQRRNLSTSWRVWKDHPRMPETYLENGKLQAIEYLGPSSVRCNKGNSSIELETASLDSFSITWSPVPGSLPPSCSILVQIKSLLTDHSHSESIPVRLYARTETLSSNTPNLLSNPTAELCFCKIKVFRDHGAERKLSSDVINVKKIIDKLE